MLLWALLAPLSAAEDCVELAGAVRGLGQALERVKLDEATALAQDAEASLTCQDAVVNTMALTVFYQLAGSIHLFKGDSASAEIYYGRAVAVSSTGGIDETLGPDAAALYDEVRQRAMSVPGGAVGAPVGLTAWLDGRLVPQGASLDVAAGAHLLQFDTPAGVKGLVVRLSPGDVVEVTLDGRLRVVPQGPPVALTEAEAPILDETSSASDGPAWPLVGAGAGAVVLGGIGLALASSSHGAFDEAATVDEAVQLRTRTNALGGAGLALTAVGLGVAGVGLVHGTPLPLGGFTWSF